MKSKGLKRKYIVTKVEGETDPNAEYFVLRVDPHEPNDPIHYHACMMALCVYSGFIANHLPGLNADLCKLYINPYLDKLDKDTPAMEGPEW